MSKGSNCVSQIISLHSFSRGAGKSCLSANLAALLAEAGRRVGVVDADLSAPSQLALWGVDEAEARFTLNDFLWGDCELNQTLLDLTARQPLAGPGRLWLAPASLHTEKIVRGLRGGAQRRRLDDMLEALRGIAAVDLWLVDAAAGLTEDTLLVFAASDEVLLVLQPDQRDYQGTAVMVDVARQLGVPRVALLLNQVPADCDGGETCRQVEAIYQCEVAGVVPFSDEQAALGSGGLLAWPHPEQALTARLKKIAAGLGGQTDHFARLREAAAQLKPVAGLLPMDLLAVPAPLGGFFRQLIRSGSAPLPHIAAALRCDLDQARQVSDVLVEKGYLRPGDPAADGQMTYRVRLAASRPRKIPLDL
jgi:septum site-determining protein MinD